MVVGDIIGGVDGIAVVAVFGDVAGIDVVSVELETRKSTWWQDNCFWCRASRDDG